MATYIRQCSTQKCPEHAKAFEVVRRASEFKTAADMDTAIRCGCCGGPTAVHPSQFGSVAVQREWKRGQGGLERESKAMVFQERGIPEIKQDCPSMDFKVRDGEAVPVFHNDAHHRKVMGELSKAKTRYAEQKAERKKNARGRIDKAAVVRKLKQKAGIVA